VGPKRLRHTTKQLRPKIQSQGQTSCGFPPLHRKISFLSKQNPFCCQLRAFLRRRLIPLLCNVYFLVCRSNCGRCGFPFFFWFYCFFFFLSTIVPAHCRGRGAWFFPVLFMQRVRCGERMVLSLASPPSPLCMVFSRCSWAGRPGLI